MPTLSKEKKSGAKAEPGKAVARRAAAKAAKSKRPIVFAEVSVDVCIGENAITYDKAKELLGWEEESDDKKKSFGGKFIFKHNDKKVRLNNNENNRPFYSGSAASLKQEVLRGRWRLNGEPIIIGVTAILLNGQHSLVAFVMAVDEWRKTPDAFPAWKTEPVLDKLIVYGIAEDDATVNTMDTCKPRSLSDVIFRAHYFKSATAGDNKDLSKMTEQGIKQMWDRFGYANAHDVRRTHAEYIAFLDTHPKLLTAVKHIWEENNKENKVGKYLKPGYAAAALYLMASSDSDSKAYFNAENPGDSNLNWDNWDKACEFFVDLAAGNDSMKEVRNAIADLINCGSGSVQERFAIMAKAWHMYKAGKPITKKSLHLEFVVKDDARHLVETPLFGGIDVGEDGLPFTDLPPEEIEANGKDVREKKHAKGRKSGKRSKGGWKEGDQAWVHDEYPEPTFVTLATDPFLRNSDKVMIVQVDGPEDTREVPVASLSTLQFEKVAIDSPEE